MSEPKPGEVTVTNRAVDGSNIEHSTQPPQPTPERFKTVNEHETARPGAAAYVDDQGLQHYSEPVETAEELVTEVIHVEDDPTLNPWTFRTWFLGIGLASFGGILATIYQFKPQQVVVSAVFLAVISFVLGEFMAWALPRKGIFGRIFNPHPVSLV
jgi:hypothetical protein